MIVRVLLLAAIAVAVAWVIRSRHSGRRQAIVRLGVLGLAVVWTVAVLQPDLVTRVANAIGVGRGTDLLLYLLVVAFTFATVGLSRKVRDLEDTIAELTRGLALVEAEVERRDAHRPPVESPERRG